jgi:ubiquinone biosynthesis protein UbiJ
LGEYLQEELRVLPSRIETENFSADVTRISMDVDRLTARLKRLQTQTDEGIDA